MNSLHVSEKSVKKSVSVKPSLWAFVLEQAGDTGTPSKVIQKAIRMLQEASETSEKASKQSLKNGIKKMGKGKKDVQ